MLAIAIVIILGLLLSSDTRPYSQVITQWARPFSLRIVYTSRYTDCFECDLDDKVLYISRYNKATHHKDEYIASVAHEIGHLIGATLDEDRPENKQISRRLTKKSIYLDEVRAWKIAQILLQDAGILNEPIFIHLKDKCLLEYKRALYAKKRS